MISRPAMEPAISTLPVKNQLIAKVSRVPRVRQLMALKTDLECVSAPRNNKATGALPYYFSQAYHVTANFGSAAVMHQRQRPRRRRAPSSPRNSLIWLFYHASHAARSESCPPTARSD